MTTHLSETQANLQREISNLPEEHTHQLSGSRYASLKPHSSRCSPVVWHDIETLRISHRAYNPIRVVESSEPIPGEHQRRCLRGTQGHKGELPSYPLSSGGGHYQTYSSIRTSLPFPKEKK